MSHEGGGSDKWRKCVTYYLNHPLKPLSTFMLFKMLMKITLVCASLVWGVKKHNNAGAHVICLEFLARFLSSFLIAEGETMLLIYFNLFCIERTNSLTIKTSSWYSVYQVFEQVSLICPLDFRLEPVYTHSSLQMVTSW